MGYTIIFKTKIINLSDGRIMHLDLSGCNNDDHGRRNDDWFAKIYNKEDFIKYAEGFKIGSKPIKELGEMEGFDLKIGSRYCTYYDYGMHLLRMMKRAVSFDELKNASFYHIDGAIIYDGDKEIKLNLKELEDFIHSPDHYGQGYSLSLTFLETEEDVVKAIDNNEELLIWIKR